MSELYLYLYSLGGGGGGVSGEGSFLNGLSEVKPWLVVICEDSFFHSAFLHSWVNYMKTS